MTDILTRDEIEALKAGCNENGLDYPLWRSLAPKILRTIDSLTDDLETEMMRLAACGVAAMANTEDCVKDRITKDNPYYSASYGDVCNAVDREMELRKLLETRGGDCVCHETSSRNCSVHGGE